MTTLTRSVDVAEGAEPPTPVPHSLKVAAEFHQGVQDAVHHDLHSIDPEQSLRREHSLGGSTVSQVQALVLALLGQLVIQYDICKDLRAALTHAVEQLRSARDALAQADSSVQTARALLPVTRPDLLADTYEPLTRRRPTWWRTAGPWLAIGVFAALEVVTNYLAMLYLRDSAWATWVLSGAATAAILGGCYFIARSSGTLRSAVLGLCVAAVILGSGVMRFHYAVDAVNQGLIDHGRPELGALTKLAILAFAVGLPTAFGIITATKFSHDPVAAKAAAQNTELLRVVDGVRRLHAYAQRCRDDFATAVARESAAADSLRNAQAALRGLCDRTDAALLAEAGYRTERLDAYFRGLMCSADDPAITTRLDHRFPTAVALMTADLAHAVQDARDQVAAIRAELLEFGVPESQRRREP